MEGLLRYLAEKINKGLLCVYCDNKGTKGFKSADAVRNHMVNKLNLLWFFSFFFDPLKQKKIKCYY